MTAPDRICLEKSMLVVDIRENEWEADQEADRRKVCVVFRLQEEMLLPQGIIHLFDEILGVFKKLFLLDMRRKGKYCGRMMERNDVETIIDAVIIQDMVISVMEKVAETIIIPTSMT